MRDGPLTSRGTPVPEDQRRLFGTPGAEVLYTTLVKAYESQVEPWADEHDRRPRTIEEFTVQPPSAHVPTARLICEWLAEWVAGQGEVTEGVFDNWDDVLRSQAAIDAAQALLDTVTSMVNGRMADQQVATYTVTWDEEGDPLINGTPLYPRES